MLAQVHRLRRSEDFSLVVRRGRKSGGRSLVVHVLGSPAEPRDTRVGFVVSKAVGPAVVRNRVKRRLRHLMAVESANLAPGSLVVVRALPGAASTSYPRLRDELVGALGRATSR